MSYENHYFVKKLNEIFSKRKQRNPNYSIRAFSRDLDVSKSTMHEVLKGKRPLPLKSVKKVIELSGLNPTESALFSESLYRSRVRLDEIKISGSSEVNRYLIDDSHFKVIAEWEHYAVLSLLDTDSFESSFSFISKRLDISLSRAKSAIENLLIAGLIKKENQSFVRCTNSLKTTEDIPSKTLVKAHKEILNQSIEKLDSVPLQERDYSTITIAANSKKITEAKIIIREFRQKIMKLLSEGNKDEVFQIGIQMYPLTQKGARSDL